MTAASEVAARDPATQTAKIISEVLSPIVVIPVGTVIVSLDSAPSWESGLGYALVAAFFAAALPYGILLAWVRRGRIADRDMRLRAQRPAILGLTSCSISVGLAVLGLMNVPRDLFALMAAMALGMALTLAVSTAWKISLHTSCLAGVVVSLGLLVSPWHLALAPLIAPTAWSRMLLKHHTLGQVLVGAALGAAVAATTLSVLR